MRKPARINREAIVGVDDQITEALELATAFFGTTISQYGRAALIEKLCRDGFMTHPLTLLQQKRPAPVNSEINSGVPHA
jgi:hypothetical protein